MTNNNIYKFPDTYTKSTFIVAELSSNHGHDINIVKKTMKAAKNAGADAIKLQTYTADTITINCSSSDFIISSGNLWNGKKLYDLYREGQMPWEWYEELFEYAKELDIICFSTPFDKTAVNLLEYLNTPLYKIASFEITDIPLIEYVASKKKPMIISTGIATFEEIKDAVSSCKRVNNSQITLLQCTSSYPAKISNANLLTMVDYNKSFDVNFGLSDHTIGSTVSIAAVALGASIIEKHFILDKRIGGPDAAFSIDEKDFVNFVSEIRLVEASLGKVDYSLTEEKLVNRKYSRSLYIVKDIKKNTILTEDNVRSIRPGNGMPPKYYNNILGKRVCCDVKSGTPLKADMLLYND